MPYESLAEDIRHHADAAKAVHSTGGFEHPASIVSALESAAAAIEKLQSRIAELENMVTK